MAEAKRHLGVFDATMLVMGGIVGGLVATPIMHDPEHALVGLGALLLGLPTYFIWRRWE